jgi:hypothetical protein
MAALQAVNAIEAERVSAVSAEAERERRKAAERKALIETGKEILLDIIARLKELAHHNAPEAIIQASHSGKLNIALGQAELVVELQGAIPSSVLFPTAKWNAVAIGRIQVSQVEPHKWSNGATLWYMQLRTDPEYRWYEVAYKQHALVQSSLVGSFPIQKLEIDIYGQADRAAGPGMHPIEIDFGPTAIDDENAEAFYERWLTRLAQAYEGCLRPF